MKNYKHIGLYLITGLALLLPFIYIHTWNPFSIKGPLFLNFYMLLMLMAYVNIILLKGKHAGLMIGITLIPGVARIIQGVHNTKPVGYLVLLLLLHLAIAGLMSRRRISTTS